MKYPQIRQIDIPKVELTAKRRNLTTEPLSRFHYLEYRRSIHHAAVVYYLPNPPRIANIRNRIGGEKNKISPLSHLDGAEILIGAEDARSAARRGMNRLHRS